MIWSDIMFPVLSRPYSLGFGLRGLLRAGLPAPRFRQVIGYYEYVKSIQYYVRDRIRPSSVFGSEGSDTGLPFSFSSELCDVGSYFTSNLFVHQFISSSKANKPSFQPNLPMLQYFNTILGSTFPPNVAIVSLLRFQLWSRLKSLIINSITDNSSCFIFNPKSRTRKGSLIYTLNLYNLMGSNLPLAVGSSLGLPSERVYITTISRFTLALTTTTSLILLSPSSHLVLTNNNTLLVLNNN